MEEKDRGREPDASPVCVGTKEQDAPEAGQLKKNSLGPIGVAFYVIAMVGPLATMTGGCLFVMQNVDKAACGIYVCAGILTLIFTVGFCALSRKCTSAGGFASFIALSFGSRIGTAAAFMAVLAYNATQIAIYVSGSLYAVQLIEYLTGFAIPWPAFAMFMLVICSLTGYFDINTSMKIVGTLMVCEIIILLILDFSIVGSPAAHVGGFDFSGFAPSNIFVAGFPIALLYAFNCFGGYEGAIVYSEETKDPKKNIPRALFIVVFFLTALYAFNTWALANGVQGDTLAAVVGATQTEFVVDMMGGYVGEAAAVIVQVLIVTSVMAACIGFHNMVARYLFALGRAGALTPKLARTHPKYKSPHIASLTQTAISFLILLFCIFSGEDGFNTVFGLSLGLGALTTLFMMVGTCLSAIVFFRRHKYSDENIFGTLIFPAVSAVALAALAVLSIVNFDMITAGYGSLWVVIPIFFAVGLIWTFFKEKGSIHLEADYSHEEESACRIEENPSPTSVEASPVE